VIFVLVVVYTVLQGGTIARPPDGSVSRRRPSRPSCRWRRLRWTGCGPTCWSCRSRGFPTRRGAHRRAAAAAGAVITLVLREETGFVPNARTRLRVGTAC
jgi:hypothetical protein